MLKLESYDLINLMIKKQKNLSPNMGKGSVYEFNCMQYYVCKATKQ